MAPTRSVIAVALLGIGVASAGARPPATAPAAQPAVISEAEAQAVRQRLQEGFRASPSQISRTAFGWYEVLVNGELLYLDPQLNYVFTGSVLDARTRANVTQSRRDELLRVDFAKLPLEHAVALTFGNGSRRFASFEDPNCGFCRKLHQDIKGLQDATLYVFVMPSLSPDSREKARAIWCAADRAASWNGLVMENRAAALGEDTAEQANGRHQLPGERLIARMSDSMPAALNPPSTLMTSPVTKLASSDNRNATTAAISDASA